MKGKSYITRVLIMCLVCVLAIVNTPLAYADAPAAVPVVAEVGPLAPTGVDTTKPYLKIKASVSGSVYTGNEFSVDYNVYTEGPSGDTSGLRDLKNALFIVPQFSRNEDADSLSAKKSKYTRAVLKTTVEKIRQAKESYGDTTFSVGFMKVGASTVLESFKTVDVSTATYANAGNYLSDIIKYSYTDTANHRKYVYLIDYGATSPSYSCSPADTTTEPGMEIYTITVHKTGNIDEDMNSWDSASSPSGCSYPGFGSNGYNALREQRLHPDSHITINDNINIDIANLFTKEKNVVSNDYGSTMAKLNDSLEAGKTQVYCVIDGYSADRFVSSGITYNDDHSSIGNYTMPSKDYGDSITSTHKIIYRGNRVTNEGNVAVGEAVYNFRYITKVDATRNSITLAQEKMDIALTTDNLNLDRVRAKCLYVNEGATAINNKPNYNMTINYDSHLSDGSNFDTPTISVDRHISTTDGTMQSLSCPCSDNGSGVITVDTGSIDEMLGTSSNKLTNVRLVQQIPGKAKVTDTANGWIKTNDAGDNLGIANGLEGDDAGNVKVGKLIGDINYNTTPATLPQYHLNLKVKKSKEYHFDGALKYKDASGADQTVNFTLVINIGSNVKVYYEDSKEIFGKKGTQKVVYLDVYAGSPKIKAVTITLKSTDNNSSTQTLPLAVASNAGVALVNIVGSSDVVTATKNTVSGTTYYVMQLPAATTFDAGDTKRIKIVFDIGTSSGKYQKGNLEVEKIEFTAQDCDPDTVEPVDKKDKVVTTYNKLIIQ